MRSFSIHIWVTFLSIQYGLAQELPPIQNFSPLDYQAENQNWSISQSDEKLIYVANNTGLLEFNGAKWTLYSSPNETIMRSVKVIEDRVYTGCYMEFGYWSKSNLGTLDYTSLSQKADSPLLEDEEFWNILGIDRWVIFQSLNRIYIYDTTDSTFDIIGSDQVITQMYQVNEDVYFQRLGAGLFKVEGGKDVLVTDHPVVKNDEVVNVFSQQKDILILTRNSGFHLLASGRMNSMASINELTNGFSIYSGLRLSNGNIALGTISNGLINLNLERRSVESYNQQNGLINNTVLSIFEDSDGNIWAGLDNGVSYINTNAPIRVFRDKKGVLGSVYASAIKEDKLYLGTNQGLFCKELSSAKEFEMIPGTEGQVWSLKHVGGDLFCGHHTGTFTVSGNRVKKVASIQGTWRVDELRGGMLLQGNYDGLYLLEKDGANWSLKNKIGGFNNSSRSFEVRGNEVIVNHEYKGVFEIKVNESLTEVISVKVDSAMKGPNSSLLDFGGEILYASRNGIYKYSESQDSFVKDETLSSIYTEDEYVSGRMIPNQSGDEFWMFTKNNLIRVSTSNIADQPKVTKIPLTLDARRDVVEYENIIAIGESDSYILGTSYGYIKLNIEELIVNQFSVSIDRINSGINEDHSATEKLIDKSVKGDFNSDENNLRISYYAPEYLEYFKPNYQYQLEGVYNSWSNWTRRSTVFYENLPPGNYTFKVRAKVGDQISENIASYQFRIAKPWYRTNLMVAIYVLSLILLSISTHTVYRRYYKGQQKKLIEENQRELELARLQNEKEITDLKNEQLEKDVKAKGNELAASTMSLVKKNELLTEIKEHLSKVEDQQPIASVIKIINSSLNENENWELFKEAFDNADAEFFKKLKSAHPDLSPNDLKLCAYLRLNLSSKEIAPLLNISPRSVEIKRYRLRKRLNLVNNENLTDYIINF